MAEDKKIEKWYFKTSTVVIAFFCVGPFALPLLWIHPRYSRKLKIAVTVIVTAFTIYSVRVIFDLYETVSKYYNNLFQQI